MKTPEETMKDIVKQVNDITCYSKLAKAAANRDQNTAGTCLSAALNAPVEQTDYGFFWM
jgi:hypothetical protein|tara:strand:+ start:257 stop:433 length:177 start_codon:yes stop_codon:yes gene_type:complete